MCLSNQSKVMEELKEKHQPNSDIPENGLCLEIPLPGFEAMECTLKLPEPVSIFSYFYEGAYVVDPYGREGQITHINSNSIYITVKGNLHSDRYNAGIPEMNLIDFKFYFHKQVVDKYRKLYPNETDPKLINAILHNLKVKKAKAINDRYEKSKKEALKRLNREFKSAKIKKDN